LLAPAQRERLLVVLVSPRNPLNIGAAARAMANFGFPRLAVVSAYPPHWREARSAVGAPHLLEMAAEYSTLSEAVADCTLVAGTAMLARRKPEQPAVALPELAPIVAGEIARGGRAALVFGSEKRGLSREDLSRCRLLVEIPTSPEQPSMNLGQAVAVCLYELAAGALRLDRAAPVSSVVAVQTASPHAQPASSATLDLLAGVVDHVMQAANYSPAEMRLANRHDLQLLLRRLTLNESDARRTLGVFRRILRAMKH
jgi:TrmH family RNA methyltransferase